MSSISLVRLTSKWPRIYSWIPTRSPFQLVLGQDYVLLPPLTLWSFMAKSISISPRRQYQTVRLRFRRPSCPIYELVLVELIIGGQFSYSCKVAKGFWLNLWWHGMVPFFYTEAAIAALKTIFSLTDWQGDPCSPVPHNWVACMGASQPGFGLRTSYSITSMYALDLCKPY